MGCTANREFPIVSISAPPFIEAGKTGPVEIDFDGADCAWIKTDLVVSLDPRNVPTYTVDVIGHEDRFLPFDTGICNIDSSGYTRSGYYDKFTFLASDLGQPNVIVKNPAGDVSVTIPITTDTITGLPSPSPSTSPSQ